MIINKINFPIYGLIILISLIIGMIFNYIFLKKYSIKTKHIMLFEAMLFIYSVFGGIFLNSIITKNFKANSIGLSSYGGAIGIIIASIIWKKIIDEREIFVQSSILSLPLIYAIAKIACFFAGCCYGIPYGGIFSVTYTFGLNIKLLPIQLIETITFIAIFIICIKLRKNKSIVGITIILSALAKFLLDFGRYSHISVKISANQVISIISIIIGIILIIKSKYKSEY